MNRYCIIQIKDFEYKIQTEDYKSYSYNLDKIQMSLENVIDILLPLGNQEERRMLSKGDLNKSDFFFLRKWLSTFAELYFLLNTESDEKILSVLNKIKQDDIKIKSFEVDNINILQGKKK